MLVSGEALGAHHVLRPQLHGAAEILDDIQLQRIGLAAVLLGFHAKVMSQRGQGGPTAAVGFDGQFDLGNLVGCGGCVLRFKLFKLGLHLGDGLEFVQGTRGFGPVRPLIAIGIRAPRCPGGHGQGSGDRGCGGIHRMQGIGEDGDLLIIIPGSALEIFRAILVVIRAGQVLLSKGLERLGHVLIMPSQ